MKASRRERDALSFAVLALALLDMNAQFYGITAARSYALLH